MFLVPSSSDLGHPLPKSYHPDEGTTFVFGSWICVATWLNHLAESKGLEASSPTQHSNIDELPSELDEIMLPVHIKEIKKQSIFDTTTTRSLTPVLESNSTQSKEPCT